MKNILAIFTLLVQLLFNTNQSNSFTLVCKIPDTFNNGIATLILAESNRDTLRAPIINGHAKFTGTRTLDTTWAFVTFKQGDLYGEMPFVVFGNQITLTAEPVETYKYIPAEKAHQEPGHIHALHTALTASNNKRSEWGGQATMYQRDERKEDSLLGLILQQRKIDNQTVLVFARNYPRETYVLHLLTAPSNYYNLRLRPDNIEALKQVYTGLDDKLKRTNTGQLLGSNIEKFSSISEGGYFPKYALPLNKDSLYQLPTKEKAYTLLHFWGSWCGPCIRHIPAWNALSRKYANADIAFVNIAINDEQKEWQKAIKRYKVAGINGIDYQDTTKSITKKTLLSFVPQYVLIDSEGKVIFNQYARNADEQFKALDSIFQKLNLRTLGL